MDNLQTLSHTSLPEPFESSDLTIEGAPKYDTDIIILREKVIVCGDEMTGKTTLIQALLARRTTSNGDYRMTQGLEMNVATLSLERDREGDNNDANVQEVDLFLYDLGGGEHSDSIFLKMTNSSIGQVVTKHCTCIIYVFDVCCRKSLQSVMRWMDILDKSLDNDRQNVPMILVGNKADLRYVSFPSVCHL